MSRLAQLQLLREACAVHGLLMGAWLIAFGGLILLELVIRAAWRARQRRRRR
jgi:hypothetical protein